MSSERLYYDDSYTTRFAANVVAIEERDGRPAVELESTYFYPESGGQQADRGTLASATVVDVQAGDDGRVWHVIGAAAPPEGRHEAVIDWARRFDAMQQHTGQHILSAAFERVLDAPTQSSTLGDERSVIEVALAEMSWRTLERIEEAANRVVWEDRPIERHWVDDEGVKRFKLRKPPAVSGRIRIVEIPEWDLSACGGTHTRRTGEVGAIKVVRWERVRGNLRFEFLCGGRALRDYAWRTEALLEAAKRRTLQDRELIAHLERAAGERDTLRRRVQELTSVLLAAEARERVGDPPRGVADFSSERPREDVRRFALQCLEAGAPWVVAGAAAPEPAVVIGRAKKGEGDLRGLVPELLAHAEGKGGGAPDFVQAGAASPAAARAAFDWAAQAVAKLVGER